MKTQARAAADAPAAGCAWDALSVLNKPVGGLPVVLDTSVAAVSGVWDRSKDGFIVLTGWTKSGRLS